MATKTVKAMNEATDDDLETFDPDKQRSVKRLMISALWAIVVVSIVGLSYYQLTRNDVLPIQEIKVTGEFSQLASQDLQPIIAEGIDGNFFTVDVARMYQQVLSLPWVEKVWIHRIWPDTIKVNFQEQTPVAILKNKGLLNRNGEVFSQNYKTFEQTLPLFVVANNYIEDAVKEYEKKLTILNKSDLKPRVFYYDERKAQTIKLSNGIMLVLGRVDVAERLNKFVKTYKSHLQYDKRKIDKVDLRYTNGLAVSWKQSLAELELFKQRMAS